MTKRNEDRVQTEDYRLRTYDYSAAIEVADSFDAMTALFYGIGRGILRDVEKSDVPAETGSQRPSPRAAVKRSTGAADKRSRDGEVARSLGITWKSSGLYGVRKRKLTLRCTTRHHGSEQQ